MSVRLWAPGPAPPPNSVSTAMVCALPTGSMMSSVTQLQATAPVRADIKHSHADSQHFPAFCIEIIWQSNSKARSLSVPQMPTLHTHEIAHCTRAHQHPPHTTLSHPTQRPPMQRATSLPLLARQGRPAHCAERLLRLLQLLPGQPVRGLLLHTCCGRCGRSRLVCCRLVRRWRPLLRRRALGRLSAPGAHPVCCRCRCCGRRGRAGTSVLAVRVLLQGSVGVVSGGVW